MPTDPQQPSAQSTTTDPLDDLNLVNAGYVADLYDRYRADPGSVDPEWRGFFDSGTSGFEPVTAAPPPANGDQRPQSATGESNAESAEPESRVPDGARRLYVSFSKTSLVRIGQFNALASRYESPTHSKYVPRI